MEILNGSRGIILADANIYIEGETKCGRVIVPPGHETEFVPPRIARYFCLENVRGLAPDTFVARAIVSW